MRILITGGCGFIGTNLVAFLQKQTGVDRILVLDNLSLGSRENLAEFQVEFMEGDIRDASKVNLAAKGVDAIIHLAADTRVIDSIENPDFNFEVNVLGTYHLLCAARKYGVEKFVMASTGGAILGEAKPPVHEGIVPQPISPYGASKLCGEAYCSAFAGSYGLKTVCLRFSNVYGPRCYHKGSVVALFFKRMLTGKPLVVYGDGEQTRDLVYVDDICAGIHSGLSAVQGGGAYHLGTGIETSVNALIEWMRSTAGEAYPVEIRKEPARTGEILRNYADISLARKVLGFNPKVMLREGLAKTWAWFMEQGSLRKE